MNPNQVRRTFGSPPPPPAVTQATLERYQALTAAYKERKKLRDEILAAHAAGAGFEPGPLAAEVTSPEYRSLSQPKLVAIVGEEYTAWIVSQLEPTPGHRLTVRPGPARPPEPCPVRPPEPCPVRPPEPPRPRGRRARPSSAYTL
jgi:hypothetical protein